MTALELLSTLRQQGIHVRLQNGALRVRSSSGNIDPALVEQITAQKAELIEILRTASGHVQATAAPRIPRAPLEPEMPLSSGQSRLWFADQLTPGTSTYSLPFAYQLTGPVRYDILERALSEIVRRHQILRTRFGSRNGMPYQSVVPPELVRVKYIDLMTAEVNRQAELERILQTEAQTPFQLETLPLFRVTMIIQGPESHVLLLTIHHIIADGWSMDLFYKELSTLYLAFEADQPSPLAELKIQYSHYALWQSKIDFGAEPYRTYMDSWKSVLDGACESLDLPSDRPPPPVRTTSGGLVPVEIPRSTCDKLARLAADEHCSMFMVTAAVFAVLLSRYTGQEDLCIGAPVAGRFAPELDELIGFFVNTVVLRCDLSGGPTVSMLLARVRDRLLQALEHQELPFERMVEELNPVRSPGRTPLFQVAFAFRNLERPPAGGHTDTQIRPLKPASTATSMYDLTLHLLESGGEVSGSIEYSSDLFDPDRIERMVQHYLQLLEAACDAPQTAVAALPLLPSAERRLVLEDWNSTLAPVPDRLCIHDQFTQQARLTPNAIAVTDLKSSFTYEELDAFSNRVARALQAKGAGPEQRVAICMERTTMLIGAMLGILKSGAAYVAIDPAYPKERVAFMLSDSEPQLVVCDVATRGQFDQGQELLCLTEDRRELKAFSDAPLEATASPSNLAYLIYTSGSTGQPKGVAIEHRQAVSFLQYARRIFGEDLRMSLASSSVCFDASIMEIFAPLGCGGTVVVLGTPLDLRTARLPAPVTFMYAAPSAIAELAQTPEVFKGVKTLSMGGEPLATSLVRQIFQTTKIERVIDVYGPTETTTFSTCSMRLPDGPQTVGRPIDNARIYILDKEQQPVPVGVPGEVYIGGLGVSRGYWKRPELTASRFLPDPFVQRPEARMYKTGDLARYRSSGEIELLGRMDDQVKVRGYRVELGEVEHVLLQHPSIREAGAAVARATDGTPILLACVSLKPGVVETADSLRGFLASRLPHYMTPGTITIRETVPRTASGKIDRREIASLRDSYIVTTVRTAPVNAVEAELLKIWSSLLPNATIGTSDNFFELGGHSLLALRMLHQIDVRMGVKLPLSVLFHAQTVKALASVLEQEASVSWSSLVALKPTGTRPPVFLIHGAGGNLLAFRDLLKRLPPDQPAYGLQFFDDQFEPDDNEVISRIASGLLTELRAVQPAGPYYLVGHCAGGTLAYEIACQLAERGDSIALVGLIDAFQRPFPLRRSIRISRRLKLLHEHLQIVVRDPQRVQYVSFKLKRASRRLVHHLKVLVNSWAPMKGRMRRSYAPFNLEEAAFYFQPRQYTGNVHLFRSSESAAMFLDVPYDYGWSEVVSGELIIHEVPGDHLTLLNDPHVTVLSEKLSRIVPDPAAQAESPMSLET